MEILKIISIIIGSIGLAVLFGFPIFLICLPTTIENLMYMYYFIPFIAIAGIGLVLIGLCFYIISDCKTPKLKESKR